MEWCHHRRPAGTVMCALGCARQDIWAWLAETQKHGCKGGERHQRALPTHGLPFLGVPPPPIPNFPQQKRLQQQQTGPSPHLELPVHDAVGVQPRQAFQEGNEHIHHKHALREPPADRSQQLNQRAPCGRSER